MTIEISNVGRLRLYEEPNGSFCTDGSGTMGNFLEVPFTEGTLSLKLEQPTESPAHAQQHIDGYPEEVLMPKRWTLDFQIGLETFTSRVANAATAPQSALGRLLKIAMGGETLQVGTTINDAGATTTSFVVTSGTGLTKGCVIALATGTGGIHEAREIKNISTNTITLKHALSSAPTNAMAVYPSATYSLGTGNGDSGTTAQFAVEGLEQDDRFLLRGGQIASSMSFAVAVGTIPKVTFSWTGPQWDYANGTNVAATLTGSALSTSTYANNQPLVVNASELRVTLNGTTSIASTLIEAPSYEFTPNLSYTAHRAPSGTQTVMRWIRTRSAPVISGSFTDPYQAQTWFTARDLRTNRAFLLQIGSSATTGGVLLTAPTIQITDVALGDSDGIRSETVSWKGRLDEDITSATTTVHQSAFRIHLF